MHFVAVSVTVHRIHMKNAADDVEKKLFVVVSFDDKNDVDMRQPDESMVASATNAAGTLIIGD